MSFRFHLPLSRSPRGSDSGPREEALYTRKPTIGTGVLPVYQGPLDIAPLNCIGAWSVGRALSVEYGELELPLVEVTTDNLTFAEIATENFRFDVDAYNTFVDGDPGFARTIYNQMGGIDAVQTDFAKQCEVDTEGINNRATVIGELDHGYDLDGFTSTNLDYTFYFVCFPSATFDQWIFDSFDGRLVMLSTGNTYAFYDGLWRNSGVSVVLAPQVISFVYEGATGAIRLNGIEILSGAYTPVDIVGITRLLAASPDTDPRAFQGPFLECLIYEGAHDEATLLAVENNLAAFARV